MRALVLCAVLTALLPSGVGAQSLPLTESEVLARLSPNSPRVRAIRAVIDRARIGHGSIVMLWDGPGVGKSRLAMEMAGYASLHPPYEFR